MSTVEVEVPPLLLATRRIVLNGIRAIAAQPYPLSLQCAFPIASLHTAVPEGSASTTRGNMTWHSPSSERAKVDVQLSIYPDGLCHTTPATLGS